MSSDEFNRWSSRRSLSAEELTAFFYELHHRGAPAAVNDEGLSPQRKSDFKNLSSEEIIVLAAQWGRTTEWRLLEIVLLWLWDSWRIFNPIFLNQLARKTKVPAVWGVLKEWTWLRREALSNAQSAFWTLVIDEIKPEPLRLFYSEGKVLPWEKAQSLWLHSENFYEKWGFIETHLPSIGKWKQLKLEPSPEMRRRVLRELSRHGPVSLKIYMKALPRLISRQTAWRDLSSMGLKKKGGTKGRVYFMRGHKIRS